MSDDKFNGDFNRWVKYGSETYPSPLEVARWARTYTQKEMYARHKLYEDHATEMEAIEKKLAEVEEPKTANANCISLSLHESRMNALESENARLRSALERIRHHVVGFKTTNEIVLEIDQALEGGEG